MGIDVHPCWRDTRFEHTKEEALSVEALVVEASSGAGEADSPEQNDAKDDSFNRIPLSQYDCRIRADDEAEVEYRCRHRIAQANF